MWCWCRPTAAVSIILNLSFGLYWYFLLMLLDVRFASCIRIFSCLLLYNIKTTCNLIVTITKQIAGFLHCVRWLYQQSTCVDGSALRTSTVALRMSWMSALLTCYRQYSCIKYTLISMWILCKTFAASFLWRCCGLGWICCAANHGMHLILVTGPQANQWTYSEPLMQPAVAQCAAKLFSIF